MKVQSQLTLGQFISGLLIDPDLKSAGNLLFWPPDVFGIVGYVLHKTGEYRKVVDNTFFKKREIHYEDKIGRVGKDWRIATENQLQRKNQRSVVPKEVKSCWQLVLKSQSEALYALPAKTIIALLDLFAYADEAFADVGLAPTQQRGAIREIAFDTKVQSLLTKTEDDPDAASLCERVRKEIVCVLPKLCTPQTGLTIRGLSHHICLWPRDEVTPRWTPVVQGSEQFPARLNLLLLPWPLHIEKEWFEEVKLDRCGRCQLPSEYGKFHFKPPSCETALTKEFASILDSARTAARETDIHGVILPEMSLTSGDELDVMYDALSGHRSPPFILAGLGQQAKNGVHEAHPPSDNLAVLSYRIGDGDKQNALWNESIQKKHHRWLVTREQAESYAIDGRLQGHTKSWEHTTVDERLIHFAPFRKGMLFTFVICEDLARQEPAARLIRAVGPNLLIALLMDGPQISNRWPAKYASVLSEDPGCSVLSLTSLGMVKLSNQGWERRIKAGVGAFSPSEVKDPVVALWRDPLSAEPLEIRMKPDAKAILLRIECRERQQYSMDGRKKSVATYHLRPEDVVSLP